MHKTAHLELPTVAALLISVANLWGIGVATWYHDSDSTAHITSWRHTLSVISLILVALSQILFVVFVLAWQLRWMRFYPGNPAETYSTWCGLLFSTAALLAASFGVGPRRWICGAVALTTAAMWLLSGAFSVAA
jgi:hypothetical protein